MFYSDFIEKYDIYELGKPGDIAVRKDGYTFYGVCSTFSSVFIKLITEFMYGHKPGTYLLIGCNFMPVDMYKVAHRKCTLSSWKYPETFQWIEGKNETPFWQALLTYTYCNKIRVKITTGRYVSPAEMMTIVNSLTDCEWDELKNRLIKVYPEILWYSGQSPTARAAAILSAAYYDEIGQYTDILLKESDSDWE